MLWGEISSFMNKRQDHEHEIALLRLQAELDDAAHRRNMEQLNLQATLGIKVVEAQTEAAVEGEEAKAFTAAMANAFKPTGIFIVDLWNGLIRPLAATIALGLWINALWTVNFRMDEWDQSLVGVILGFFFASRVLARGQR